MNQRRMKRYSIFVETKAESDPIRADGIAVNFSYQGVGLCSLTPLPIDSKVRLTFRFNDEQGNAHSESILGIVRWARSFGPLQTSGIEFSSPLDEENHFVTLSQIEMAKELENQ